MIKNLNYNIIGNGEKVILFLHGWGMNNSCFHQIAAKIDQHYKIISLDFFGFGESDNPDEWFDTYEYSYYVYLLLKELGIDRCTIIGHSFGGRIGCTLSSVFDLLIDNLILTSSAGIRTFSLIRTIKILNYKLLKKLYTCRLIKKDKTNNMGSVDYKNLSRISTQIFIRIVNQDLRHLCKIIEAPTKLVWDKNDKVTTFKECKIFKKVIKNAQVILFKTGGHFTCFYNPYKFAKIIQNIE